MTSAKLVGGLGCILLVCCTVVAGERSANLAAPQPLAATAQQSQQPEKKVGQEKKDDKTAPPQVDFSEAPPQTAEATRGPRPNMIGDFGPIFSTILVPVPSLTKLSSPQLEGRTIDFPFTGRRAVLAPVSSRGGFKIGENESPLPQDRVYLSYNYYNNVQGPANGSDQSQSTSQLVTFQGREFTADTFIPGVAPPRMDVSRQTLGIEKSFLDGLFSLGMRIPFYQQNGAQQFSDNGLGDMTFVAKYAPYINRLTGSGVSYGLAVTVPTGPSLETPTGTINSTILQPFTGYQLAGDRLMLYGFLSLAVPTESQDVTLLFNDIGIGYRMFDGTGGLVTAVIPAVEAHVTTPLNHREAGAVLQGFDIVVLTGGVHFGLGRQSLLTLGVATPVTGPRPFEVEGVVQFNLRF